MSHPNYSFEAQPPSTVAFEEFYSVSPAFLLAKVDGDELVHILESQPQTPFDTPRLESQLDFDEDSGIDSGSGYNATKDRKTKKPSISGPKPITGRPDTTMKVPQQALDNFEVPMPRPGHDIGNSGNLEEENESDTFFQGPWQEYKGIKWSVNHAKILLLLAMYSDRMKTKFGKNVWIREGHLIVMVFEGVQAGIFNLRTAPSSVVIPGNSEPGWIWWNIPCGLVTYICDLCSEKLCTSIRLFDPKYTPSAAFQMTSLGRQFISQMPDALRLEISTFLESSNADDPQVMDVKINESIIITTPDGSEQRSEIDSCLKIPFVTSPYIPLCLRFTTEACSDNAGFASQCAVWNDRPSTHRVECMCFGNVSICLCEYLPLGPNMIQSVSETLGSRDRFSASTRSKNGFILKQRMKGNSVPSLFTRATPLDWNFVNQINYEASILHSKNEAVIRCLEEFGVHINQDGTVLCGLQIEAVSDKEWDDISPELLAKVLCQFQLDSTIVVDNAYPDLLFEYLDCIYFGKGASRVKYVCMIADLIEPKLSAKEYKNNKKYANELAWVIGDIISAEDLGDTDVILIGSKGVILVGAHARDHEEIATTFAALSARKIFLDRFYQRASCLSDDLSKMYLSLLDLDEDQSRLDALYRSILESSSQFKILNAVLSHFTLSAQSQSSQFDVPKSAYGRALHNLFRITDIRNEQLDRAGDLKILITRINQDLSALMDLSSFEERKNVARCFSTLQRQTLHLAREKGAIITHSGAMILSDGCAIRMVVVCFAGLLAARIIDRINSSSLTNSNAPHWFSNALDGNVNSQPFLLFAIQLLIILVFCIVIHKRTTLFERRTVRFVRRKLTLNLKIRDLMSLFRYLDGIGCENVLFKAKVIEIDESKSRIRGEDGLLFVTYQENQGFKWFGDSPKVTLEIDIVHGWIKTAEYSWDFWADAQIKVNLLAHIRGILLESGAVQET